jgi:hypothetical protein
MLQFCGRRFRVDKRAVKVCDTINATGMYRMDHAVHLADVRCDGSGHGGCQAGCLIYWKEAWLKRVDDGVEAAHAAEPEKEGETVRLAPRDDARACASSPDDTVYSCQATELMRAAPTYIPSWDLRQYVLDVRAGNTNTWSAIRGVAVWAFNKYQDYSRRRFPSWLRIHDGQTYPFIDGTLQKTPKAALDLQPGELVRVKPLSEIVKTLDGSKRNRGMTFDSEMVQYCGRQARVLRRVDKIIDEKTGRMTHLKTPCVILEGVTCTSDYHRLCPRGIYPYWREIWLERVQSSIVFEPGSTEQHPASSSTHA